MTTHEVLVDARNLIDNKGWAPEPSSHGPYCVGLALSTAGDVALKWSAHRVLGGVLRVPEPELGLNWLYEWNDAPGRTKEEVLALFDKAIAQTAPAPDTSFLSEVREEVAA